MRIIKPTPEGVHSPARPVLTTVAIAATLLLAACGNSSDDSSGSSASPSASDAPSTSASPSASTTSPSASPSESPSSSDSPAPSASPSQSASGDDRSGERVPSDDQDDRSARKDSGAAAGAKPEEPLAHAPELGMPPAKPFDPQNPGGSTGGGVCNPSQLAGSVSPSQGAAGSVITTITLTNTGDASCVLHGFPGVSFVDGQGNPVGAPASRDAAGGGAGVTLRPGASASAGLKVTNPGVIGQVCNPRSASGLRIYPPGSYESLVIDYSAQACGNPKVEQLQVKGFGS